MNVQKGLKGLGALFVGLFVLVLLIAVGFIGGDKVQESACETAQTGYAWEAGTCYNESTAASGNVSARTTPTVNAVTYTGYAKTGMITAAGLISLFVIVAIFAIIIMMAVEFVRSTKGM